MLRTLFTGLTTASILVLTYTPATVAQGLEDQWYIGIGGGLSTIKPKADASEGDLETDSEEGTVTSLTIGRDFDRLSSGQLQFYSLGEATFDNAQSVDYQGAEASLLYRFYDSRDNSRRRSALGASIYGRFGIGYLQRDSEVDLNNDTPTYFGAGAGVEAYLTRNFGLRLEAQYLDTDASAASISLIGRFGGYRNRLMSSLNLPTNTGAASRDNGASTRADQLTAEAEARATVQPEVRQAATSSTSEPSSTLQGSAQQEALPSDQGEVELFDQEDESSYIARVPLPTEAEPSVESESPSSPGTDNDVDQDNVDPNAAQSTAASSLGDAIPDVEILGGSAESDDSKSVEVATANEDTKNTAQTTITTASASGSDALDSDRDGIVDANDKCPGSAPGFPVNLAGCGVFEGELSGIEFSSDNNSIINGTAQTLDSFALLLRDYPRSRIEVVAHTDSSGSEAEQSARTRARLKTIGAYLVRRGATTNQLVLRSFGAKRAKYDNQTTAGRRANNRIEVFERPR